MLFIWAVGVEGSGHHMVFDVLFHKLKTKKYFMFESDGDGALKELHQNLSKLFEYTSSSTDRLQARKNIDQLLSTYSKMDTIEELLLFDRNSHPYLNPRDTLRRWDIIDFVDIVSKHAKPRLLVLLRNPLNATFSCLRRGFTNNITLQAKIIEDNFICINSQLQTINDQRVFRILDYDDFFHDPKFYIERLSGWLKINEEVLDGREMIRKPKGIEDIPGDIREFLDQFFSDQRISQWSWLYQSKYNFSNEKTTKSTQ